MIDMRQQSQMTSVQVKHIDNCALKESKGDQLVVKKKKYIKIKFKKSHGYS